MAAHQAPQSLGFSRQEYWSGVPLPSLDKSRQCIKKQRHYFADKGPYSQSYGFSSSHVWMGELDHKEPEGQEGVKAVRETGAQEEVQMEREDRSSSLEHPSYCR